jgi:hypothetical protein
MDSDQLCVGRPSYYVPLRFSRAYTQARCVNRAVKLRAETVSQIRCDRQGKQPMNDRTTSDGRDEYPHYVPNACRIMVWMHEQQL